MAEGNVNPEAAREFREGLTWLGWSPRMAAERWNINLRTVERWLSGEKPVPKSMLRLLKFERALAESPLDLGD